MICRYTVRTWWFMGYWKLYIPRGIKISAVLKSISSSSTTSVCVFVLEDLDCKFLYVLIFPNDGARMCNIDDTDFNVQYKNIRILQVVIMVLDNISDFMWSVVSTKYGSNHNCTIFQGRGHHGSEVMLATSKKILPYQDTL